MIGMVSCATKFTEAYRYHGLGTVIFSDFMYLYIRGDKMNKFSKLLNMINSTESHTKDMVLKFLPDTSHELNILQKNYQDLYQQDKLVMHLT